MAGWTQSSHFKKEGGTLEVKGVNIDWKTEIRN